MGIRYFARPLPARLVDAARTDPQLILRDREYCDYLDALDGHERDAVAPFCTAKHSLDLDKSFSDFRTLWRDDPARPRPAVELVDGWVTERADGWIPHYGVIAPERVAKVREDVMMTDETDIDSFIRGGRGRYEDEPDLYVRDLIQRRDDMLIFLDQRVAREEGVLYRIG